MPHFEDFYAAKLRGSLGVTDAESVLDLRGANRATAEASLKDMLERSRFAKGKTVAIRLDPPPEGGGETLFQPELCAGNGSRAGRRALTRRSVTGRRSGRRSSRQPVTNIRIPASQVCR